MGTFPLCDGDDYERLKLVIMIMKEGEYKYFCHISHLHQPKIHSIESIRFQNRHFLVKVYVSGMKFIKKIDFKVQNRQY